MQPVQLEINTAIKDTFKMLERLLDDNITCHRLASPQELWIEGDPTMLDQAGHEPLPQRKGRDAKWGDLDVGDESRRI